jgi:hypothetical protein
LKYTEKKCKESEKREREKDRKREREGRSVVLKVVSSCETSQTEQMEMYLADRQSDRRTDRQNDRRTDGQTQGKQRLHTWISDA